MHKIRVNILLIAVMVFIMGITAYAFDEMQLAGTALGGLLGIATQILDKN